MTLSYDGDKIGERRVDATQPFAFPADEGVDVGCETGAAVAPDTTVADCTFTGEINCVEVNVGGHDHSHLVNPADRIRVLMARQ